MIVTNDSQISNLPSPEPIWTVCQKLSVDIEDTMFVSHGLGHIQGGMNAKCGKVAGVLTGNCNYSELKKAKVDVIFDTAMEVQTYIANNN